MGDPASRRPPQKSEAAAVAGRVLLGQLVLVLAPVMATVIVYRREKRRVANSIPDGREDMTVEAVSQATENPIVMDDEHDDDDDGGGGDGLEGGVQKEQEFGVHTDTAQAEATQESQ
eukprot:COSAG01_NODE_19737_length_992_cov_3.260918_1_plen_117_part_00